MSTSVTRSPSRSTTSVDEIARRAGHVGHDRARGADERVEQARLADVRLADDRDLSPRAPAGRGAPSRSNASSARAQPRRSPTSTAPGLDEVIALFGKIDRRFEPRDQIEQRRVDRRRSPSSVCLQLIERGAGLQRRDRIDQIGDRFGLRQIDPAVQKRAQRELAGLREPRAAP